jgi:hypothetical protein
MPSEQDIITFQIHQVVATFAEAEHFEDAVEAVKAMGFDRSQISLVASHDAVEAKIASRLQHSGKKFDDSAIPQGISTDRDTVKTERTMAIGLPAYIGGAGAGLAIVATGGALAIAAGVAAVGAAAGAGIGTLLAKAISEHHAHFLEKQLQMGKLLLTVDLDNIEREGLVVEALKRSGAEDVRTTTVSRYWNPSAYAYGRMGPYAYSGMGMFMP